MKLRQRDRVILFDGVCNLCNSWVLFVIDRDASGDFAFAPLQGLTAEELIALGSTEALKLNSLLLFDRGAIFDRSTAVLRVTRRLRGAWKLTSILLFVPRPLRDFAYSFVATRRYAWFGKTAVCRLPTPELQSRFVSGLVANEGK
jgi:predicted DCC family thiol-disulfide oxidoreductase YuxK